jgi:hypothetical protein
MHKNSGSELTTSLLKAGYKVRLAYMAVQLWDNTPGIESSVDDLCERNNPLVVGRAYHV